MVAYHQMDLHVFRFKDTLILPTSIHNSTYLADLYSVVSMLPFNSARKNLKIEP